MKKILNIRSKRNRESSSYFTMRQDRPIHKSLDEGNTGGVFVEFYPPKKNEPKFQIEPTSVVIKPIQKK